MRVIALAAICVAILAKSGSALPYGDDNNDIYSNDEYEDVDGGDSSNTGQHRSDNVILTIPKFVSKPQDDLVNEGGTVRLNCLVDRLEGFVLLWMRNVDEIIAVNDRVIGNDPRMKLEKHENGNSLVINNAEEKDAANYTCQISTYKPSNLDHTVRIRVRPEVVPVPANGIILAKTGSSVTLGCQVTRGSPQPEVKWHRRERKMPSGEKEIRGLSLTYTAVTRHHSGNYICSADNGFGEPSETVLKLDVQHRPEIEQEETFIHTGEGDETEIICIVHSSPRAEVTWLKDGREVTSGADGLIVNTRGNRHTLLIASVRESSFGDYACKATNELGDDEKTVRVSGKAGDVKFHSDPKGPSYDRYLLEWTGESATPITQFRVQWRAERGGDGQWNDAEAAAARLPAQPGAAQSTSMFRGTHTIGALRPKTVYLARVASKNDYGFNDYGKVFKFATKGADPVQVPITGSASSTLRPEFGLFLAAVSAALVLFRN